MKHQQRAASSIGNFLRNFRVHKKTIQGAVIVLAAWLPGIVCGAAPIKMPMTAAQWEPRIGATVDFKQMEGFPAGLLDLKHGVVGLKHFTFQDGTIELDMKTVGDGMPGITFRQSDDDTAEEIYLRPGPDCPASQDCVQYAPVTHGAMLWDVYPEYQKPAPVAPNGWNHIKIVVSGRRMDLYVNGASMPTLAVDELQGDAVQGGIRLHGPATFANLVITSNENDAMIPNRFEGTADGDAQYIRSWHVSPFFVLAKGRDISNGDVPLDAASWRPVNAEAKGLINLNRLYKAPDPGQIRCVAWLETVIQSTDDQSKLVSIGWLREVWVFVNGKPLFAGRNFWDPPGPKLTPDGRLSLENGSFVLPLKQGSNTLTVALSNEDSDSSTHYGWGLKMHVEDVAGLTFERPGSLQ